MKEIKSLFVIGLICLSVAGCKEKEPEKISKYTIWLGTAGFQLGNDTESYEIKDGFLEFVNAKTGRKIMAPYENLFQIDINKTTDKDSVL